MFGLNKKLLKLAPKLSFQQILEIAKLVCAVVEAIPATSKRIFVPHTATSLTPQAVAKCYRFPYAPIEKTRGRKIVILEFGGSFDPQDVYNWCDHQVPPIPHPFIEKRFVGGATEVSDPQGADGEVCLDLCVIAATCPGAHLIVIYGPNSEQGFELAAADALTCHPDSISISWGGPEDQWSQAGREALDAVFKAGKENGKNFFCASGDSGSGDGEAGNHVDYPASSPYVVACGGTKLSLNPDGSRAAESAWTPGLFGQGGASGGGVSSVYAGRRVPDVAANADPNTGYLIEIDGQPQQVGGTSAVAPLYASLQALYNAIVGEDVGMIGTKFYAHPECFFDVVDGNNGAYKAGPGYDMVTGLGVVDATQFLAAIQK